LVKKEARIDLILPSTFEESKILAYAAYKEIGSMENSTATNFVLSLFNEGQISENYDKSMKRFSIILNTR
jgi:hypothetical protein